MATAEYYMNLMKQASGVQQQSIADLVAALGGTTNPATSTYQRAQNVSVIDPTILSISEYLSKLGAEGYQYDYDTILNNLNAASKAGYEVTDAGLQQANAELNRNLAANQQSAVDTIRSQYAAAINAGINQGMQNANVLSTLLGNTQQNAEAAQQQALDRYNAAKAYAAELVSNQNSALSTSNSAYETLMGNIRQLYNDQIQQRTAELEHNASLEETYANYLANKYAADTNYASAVNTAASNVWGTLQNALATIASAGSAAEAQDNYSAAYAAAQQAAAAAAAAAAAQSSSSSSNDDDDAWSYDKDVLGIGKTTTSLAAQNAAASSSGTGYAINSGGQQVGYASTAKAAQAHDDANNAKNAKTSTAVNGRVYGWVGEK